MINSIKNFFWRSETIFWARLQMLVGITWGVLSVADLSPILSGKYLTYWLIVNGIISEYLRRRGAEKTTVSVAEIAKDGTIAEVPKSFLATPPPGP